MTATTVGTASDFRVGEVIVRSFDLLRQHFLKFMALAFAMWLPDLLLLPSNFNAGQQVGPGQQVTFTFGQSYHARNGAEAALAGLIWLFLFALCQPAIMYGTYQSMRGRGFQIGEAFGRAFRRLLPVIGTLIVAGISIVVGLILLIVPGIVFSMMFYVAIPVCVIERFGPFRSLGRSRELTKGYRWRIFGLALLLLLLSAVGQGLEKALSIAIGGIPAIAGDAVVQVGILTFQLIVYAVAYYDLRAAREGIDIEELAFVFD